MKRKKHHEKKLTILAIRRNANRLNTHHTKVQWRESHFGFNDWKADVEPLYAAIGSRTIADRANMRLRLISLIPFLALCTEFGGEAGTSSDSGKEPEQQMKVNLTQGERDWVKAHPQVRWGADPDWPPFSSFNRRGKFEGIDADITRLVAERAGLNLILVPASSWADVYQKAKAGEVDFLSATAHSTERLQSFAYTDDYGSFPVVIVTRSESPFLTSATDLSHMTLAEPRDHITTRQLEKRFPDAHIVLSDTAEEALRLVARGKASATFQNLAVATRIVRLNGLTNLKISGVTRFEFPLHFAVRKDAPELVSILNKGLATITADEQERIYATHLTPDIGKARDWSVWRRRVLYSLAIGIPTVGALIVWNRCLAQQIRLRETAETALREARDCLKQHADDLDRRVAEGERLNSDLRMVNQDLDAFASSASHDLRGPLRRINASAGLIGAETENRLTSESRQWLVRITDETTRMNQLIHDLFVFARLGRAELHKQRLDLTHLVNEIVDDFRSQLQERDVNWKIAALGNVTGDPGLLRVALTNLIDNAVKYSRRCREAQIKIDLLPNAAGPDEKTFYIQDNGCGFDMTEARALFTPFHRLHRSKDYEGTGIGLANVKKIIEKHHGRIWFESQPNKGTTFFFSLPAETETSAFPASEERVELCGSEHRSESLQHFH